MRILIVFLMGFISFSSFAQSRLAMSFTGNYNFALNDLKTNFNDGLGLNAELYYFFDDSPFAISLSLGSSVFYANEVYKKAYVDAQKDKLDKFHYEIKQYSIPILLAANYRFFRTKKIQPSVGISAGLYSLTHKFKQISDHFSDTRIDTENEFGIYPHLGLMYKITDDIGVLIKGGYTQSFGTTSISYADVRLGLIYKI